MELQSVETGAADKKPQLAITFNYKASSDVRIQ
jgi:hypothetical protein